MEAHVGGISLKRDECNLRLKRLAPSISLSCKLVAVQHREYEYGLVTIALMPTSLTKISHNSKEIHIEKNNEKPCETYLFVNILWLTIITNIITMENYTFKYLLLIPFVLAKSVHQSPFLPLS